MLVTACLTIALYSAVKPPHVGARVVTKEHSAQILRDATVLDRHGFFPVSPLYWTGNDRGRRWFDSEEWGEAGYWLCIDIHRGVDSIPRYYFPNHLKMQDPVARMNATLDDLIRMKMWRDAGDLDRAKRIAIAFAAESEANRRDIRGALEQLEEARSEMNELCKMLPKKLAGAPLQEWADKLESRRERFFLETYKARDSGFSPPTDDVRPVAIFPVGKFDRLYYCVYKSYPRSQDPSEEAILTRWDLTRSGPRRRWQRKFRRSRAKSEGAGSLVRYADTLDIAEDKDPGTFLVPEEGESSSLPLPPDLSAHFPMVVYDYNGPGDPSYMHTVYFVDRDGGGRGFDRIPNGQPLPGTMLVLPPEIRQIAAQHLFHLRDWPLFASPKLNGKGP